jgi:PKHD-type hydroxylase
MILIIGDVLDKEDVTQLRTAAAAFPYAPGEAGWATATVKSNRQAVPCAETERLADSIAARLTGNEMFQLAAQPKRIIGPLLSCYSVGDSYGAHVDDALMDGARADLAFTLFLSEPHDYDGGDLILQTALGDEAYKLPAGNVLLYPAITLHRVAPVTRGVRQVAAGWVRSFVRDPAQRALIFDLETARRAIFARDGKTHEFDLISKSVTNLVRMWCDD